MTSKKSLVVSLFGAIYAKFENISLIDERERYSTSGEFVEKDIQDPFSFILKLKDESVESSFIVSFMNKNEKNIVFSHSMYAGQAIHTLVYTMNRMMAEAAFFEEEEILGPLSDEAFKYYEGFDWDDRMSRIHCARMMMEDIFPNTFRPNPYSRIRGIVEIMPRKQVKEADRQLGMVLEISRIAERVIQKNQEEEMTWSRQIKISEGLSRSILDMLHLAQEGGLDKKTVESFRNMHCEVRAREYGKHLVF